MVGVRPRGLRGAGFVLVNDAFGRTSESPLGKSLIGRPFRKLLNIQTILQTTPRLSRHSLEYLGGGPQQVFLLYTRPLLELAFCVKAILFCHMEPLK